VNRPTPTAAALVLATTAIAATLLGCDPVRPTSRPAAAASASPPNARGADPAPTTQSAPTQSPAVAVVNGRSITLEELEKPLIDAYGLNVLLNLVQLELARQNAAQANVSITPADVERERQLTLEKMFKDAEKADYDRLLEQFLSQQRITAPEFDIVIRTNAYLRKIAEPLLKDKVTEENLQEAFRTLYGENVEVRDIQVANLQEIAAVRQRLAAGDSFERVAREMSRDPRTKSQGGLLPPFSREITNLSQAFKDAAFALREPGEVSDPVQTGDSFHLIQLVRKIAPKAVKFEDVKESVRAELNDRLMQATIAQLRRELARTTMQTMDIRDPVLKRQFEAKLGKQQAEARDRDRARAEIEKQRQDLSQRQTVDVPGITPPTPPATPTTTPAPEARERPPATRSGQ
jgi:parvulin-like peptidyl-prolyl isomerase